MATSKILASSKSLVSYKSMVSSKSLAPSKSVVPLVPSKSSVVSSPKSVAPSKSDYDDTHGVYDKIFEMENNSPYNKLVAEYIRIIDSKIKQAVIANDSEEKPRQYAHVDLTVNVDGNFIPIMISEFKAETTKESKIFSGMHHAHYGKRIKNLPWSYRDFEDLKKHGLSMKIVEVKNGKKITSDWALPAFRFVQRRWLMNNRFVVDVTDTDKFANDSIIIKVYRNKPPAFIKRMDLWHNFNKIPNIDSQDEKQIVKKDIEEDIEEDIVESKGVDVPNERDIEIACDAIVKKIIENVDNEDSLADSLISLIAKRVSEQVKSDLESFE